MEPTSSEIRYVLLNRFANGDNATQAHKHLSFSYDSSVLSAKLLQPISSQSCEGSPHWEQNRCLGHPLFRWAVRAHLRQVKLSVHVWCIRIHFLHQPQLINPVLSKKCTVFELKCTNIPRNNRGKRK